jgi:acetolactate synthase-1/2/3 large subunit
MSHSTVSQRAPRKGKTVARVVVEFLRARGVLRVYGLVGGHIQPLWDELVEQGVEIIDVRHEAAAVQMAHAESLLTGRLGVAMVTAGPGLTNAVTGIANAHVSRAAVLLISGRTPRPQTGMGAMQDVAQAAIVAPLCRRVESVSERHHALPRLDAVTRAALGSDGPPGPAYIDFPTDLLRETVSNEEVDPQWLRPWVPPVLLPDDEDVSEAARFLRLARRPLVVSGRGARGCSDLLLRLLEASGAVHLDTSESRGIAAWHPAFVPAMRGRAIAEADLVVTLGRRLDFQLAYGSPAVFAPDANFIRIGRTVDEISDNRRGAVEIKADVRSALARLLTMDVTPDGNREWRDELVVANRERTRILASHLAEARVGSDGRMHPYTVIAAINDQIDENTVTIVDGGDILSFARVALKVTEFYLDPGPLGCIGVGVPFANAAALTLTGRRVVALIGDGSFGFLAMELDTAARKQARAVYVVANNEGWNIDRHDQLRNYQHVAGVELPGCRYDQLARALGVHAERVEHVSDLSGALKRAFENAPALVDVLVSAAPTSPDFESGLAEVCTWQALRKWSDAEEARLKSAAVPTV